MNVIYSINGPVIKIKGATDFQIMEMVYVGENRLLGEVISINKQFTVIQVYESTSGIKPGEPVINTGEPISLDLGPGLLRNIFDGIERPLQSIAAKSGNYIVPGSDVKPLDESKEWDVTFTCKKGDILTSGDIFATLEETELIIHKLMVPNNISGEVIKVQKNGVYKLRDTLIKLKDESGKVHELNMVQRWPIKTPRPFLKRKTLSIPLISGQRVIDTLFPIAKGGTAAVPGGFGTGKTMMQHQFAKWCDADIIIYIGCGERGNEMTQTLEEFKDLVDPKSNKPLIDRTVLIE